MHAHGTGLFASAIGLAALASSGCGALGAATGKVTETTGQVQQTTGAADQAKGAADQNLDKAKAEKDKAKAPKGGAGGGAKGGDPDGDGTRATAKEGKLNEPLTDNLDPKKGDATDWRYFELAGRPALATAQVSWDDTTADLAIEVYDAFGSQLATSPPRGPSATKRVLAQIDQPGRYYVKVSSLKGASDYTMALKWQGQGQATSSAAAPSSSPAGAPRGSGGSPGAAAPAPPPPGGSPASAGGAGQIPNPAGAAGGGPPPGGGPAPPGAPAAAGPTIPTAEDPLHPRGKVVQSFRGDDGRLTLYIDKGSAASIKAGMTGYLLDGKEEKKLDGSDFTITDVIDATHSVAKTAIAKVGRNNRCLINLTR